MSIERIELIIPPELRPKQTSFSTLAMSRHVRLAKDSNRHDSGKNGSRLSRSLGIESGDRSTSRPGRLVQEELISSRWLSMAGTFARISTLDARHVLDVKDMLHLAMARTENRRWEITRNNARRVMTNVTLCLTSSRTQYAMLIRIVITEEDGERADNCTRAPVHSIGESG